jgi:hypothetical protein
VTSASLRAKLQDAVEKALAGDWEAAHVIVQEHEEDATANWIHAVCHRMEGDVTNARYWYGRIRREYRPAVSTDDELREIQVTLRPTP